MGKKKYFKQSVLTLASSFNLQAASFLKLGSPVSPPEERSAQLTYQLWRVLHWANARQRGNDTRAALQKSPVEIRRHHHQSGSTLQGISSPSTAGGGVEFLPEKPMVWPGSLKHFENKGLILGDPQGWLCPSPTSTPRWTTLHAQGS